jgi:hypothetical protein
VGKSSEYRESFVEFAIARVRGAGHDYVQNCPKKPQRIYDVT